MRRDPIVIRPYDRDWPRSFSEQAARLSPLIESHLVGPVEHIGSTAVPGLPAKPIIDMLAVVGLFESFEAAVPGLASIGWARAPEPGDQDRRKWSLCYPTIEHRSYHLHVVERDSAGWRDWLLFRDYLRSHPDEMERYATLKQDLASADPRDRQRYRSGKDPLISALMSKAHVWRAGNQSR